MIEDDADAHRLRLGLGVAPIKAEGGGSSSGILQKRSARGRHYIPPGNTKLQRLILPVLDVSIWRRIWNVNDGTVRQTAFWMPGRGHDFVLENSFSRNDGSRLDFNLRPRLQQAGDNDEAHCRKMASDDPPIGFTDFLLPRNIGRL